MTGDPGGGPERVRRRADGAPARPHRGVVHTASGRDRNPVHTASGRDRDPVHAASGRHRTPVHAASGNRLGAAHPRQEGPADLRLVPPALAAWATAAVTLDAPRWTVVGVTVVCFALGVGLLVARRATGATIAAALLCVAAAAASAGLHGADLRRGPVPVLARQYATVTADVEITGDARRSRPRVRGDHVTAPSVTIQADVRAVEETNGRRTATRAPILLIVDGGGGTGERARAAARAEARAAARAEARAGAKAKARAGAKAEARAGAGPGKSWPDLLPSTTLRVTGRLAPPLLGGDRIAAVLRVRGSDAPRVVGEPSGPQRLAGRLRAGLREATDGLPSDARALLPGLVVGDTSRITPELDDAFKETDLTHTLAVSGANFTVLLALLLGPPGLAQRAERRGLAPRLGLPLRTTALLGAGASLGFVVVCRPDPSVLRAAACGAVALLALATGRRRSLIPALATAVLLLVLYDPWLARSYGFLLSVLATGALLTVAPRWSEALRKRRVPPRLAEALATAGAAQAVCAPVVAVLSARVSLVGVPCNLLAEVAVAPATVLGFAALVMAPLAMPAAKVLAWCGSWPARWIAGVARTGAALPGGGVDWPGTWTGALLLALAIGLAVVAGRRLLRHPWVCAACGILLVLFVTQPAPLTRVITGWPPPGWRLVMCDVGQGDATVLAAGGGSAVVVDAGPDPRLVDRCLRTLGVTRIPLVVLTHFHADHVAGLPGVLRGRAVGAIETTALEQPPDQVHLVRSEAAAHHIPLTRAAAGEERRVGNLSWQVLWPPTAPTAALDGPNDASVTLLVRTAGLRILMLGDLEPPAQQALARSPAAASLRGVDVLKVAHHGSAHQDPALLHLTAPRLALVSVGTDNPYGHPAPATLTALRVQGTTVLRTDQDGSLAVLGSSGPGPDAGLRVTSD